MKKIFNPLFLFYFFSFWFVFFNYEKYRAWQDDTPFSSDALIYYYYIDAAFVKHDITFNFPGNTDYGLNVAPNSGRLPKMTMGVALLQTPLFFFADHIARSSGYEHTGFSPPYKWVLHFGVMLYVFTGIFFLYKALTNFYNKWISIAVCFIMLYATNLFYYVFGFNQMSHGYLFFLTSIIIWSSVKWHFSQKKGFLYFSFFLIGFATLIRPTEILWTLIPICIGVRTKSDILLRITYFLKNKLTLLLCFLFFLIPLLPQLMYWKMQTGNFIYYSYNDEKFFFLDPKIFQSLFSYHNGLIPYSPILIFAFIGLVFLFIKNRAMFWPVFLFMLLNIFVLSSWWMWTYAGSLGGRAYTQSYSLLAFSIASFIAWVIEKTSSKTILKSGVVGLLIIIGIYFTNLNMIMELQFQRTIIHWSAMTKDAYWIVFGKEELSGEEWDKLHKAQKEPDPSQMKKGFRDID